MKQRFLFVLILLLSLSATAFAIEDTAAPTVAALSVTPDTVALGESVWVTVRLSDSAGVAEDNYVSLYTSAGAVATEKLTLVTGDSNDGIYQCIISVPSGYSAGTWYVSLNAYDVLGNGSQTFRKEFTVTGEVDTTGPVVQDFSISPTSVDPGDTIVATVKLSDPSGIWTDNSVSLYSSAGWSAGATLKLISGDACNGTYRASVVVPEGYSGGTWYADLEAYDTLMNLTDADRIPFTVSGVVDTDGPEVDTLSLSHKNLLVGDTLTVVVRLTDVIGVKDGNLVYLYSNAGACAWTELERFMGDQYDGMYLCRIPIPGGFSEGEWRVSLTAYDLFGNDSETTDKTLNVFDLLGHTVLELPTELKSIDSQAFANTVAEVIVIPENCESIAEDAFLNCEKLKFIVNRSEVELAPIEDVPIIQ